MSDYVHDLANHVEQILTAMLSARRIVPRRLQRATALLERGVTRARMRGDRPLIAVFSACQTGLVRQPLHRITDRQLEAVCRVMRLIADGGSIEPDDVALAEGLLKGAGFSVAAD